MVETKEDLDKVFAALTDESPEGAGFAHSGSLGELLAEDSRYDDLWERRDNRWLPELLGRVRGSPMALRVGEHIALPRAAARASLTSTAALIGTRRVPMALRN